MGLVTFLKGRWSWVKQKPLVWLNMALLIATAYFVAYPGPVTAAGLSDFRIRAWAALLQLLGAGTVWYDLTSSARYLGKESIWMSTWNWMRAFLGKQHLAVGTLVGNASAFMGGRARLEIRRPASPEKSIESRVADLEYNQARLDEDLKDVIKQIGNVEADHQGRLKEEQAAREAAIRDLNERLRESIVGNYASLAFGAWWVAMGIVLSTFSPEIAKAAAGQWAELWKVM